VNRRALVLAACVLCLARPAASIVDGMVDPNTAGSPWAGVGSIADGRGGTYSGVAIAPRFVLTAAHVVAGVAPGSLSFNVNRGGDLVARLPVTAVHVHPAYQGFTRARDALVHDDIAVLQLGESIPFGTPIYPLAARAPRPGERLVLVGYGVGGPSIPADPAVKRVGSNVVEQVYQDVAGAGRIELYRFAYNPAPGGSLLESTLASGDTGSPALLRDGEGWQLAGINTFVYGADSGARGGGGIAVAAYREWILSILAVGPQRR
jgi:hypothetical protein